MSKATIRDVAALAGTSVASVSRVVSGGAHVSAALRERIESAICALAFVPHAGARALSVGGNSHVEVRTLIEDDDLGGPMLHAIARRCSDPVAPIRLLASSDGRTDCPEARSVAPTSGMILLVSPGAAGGAPGHVIHAHPLRRGSREAAAEAAMNLIGQGPSRIVTIILDRASSGAD